MPGRAQLVDHLAREVPDVAERAAVDQGLGGRFEHLEPVERLDHRRSDDERAVVLEQQHRLLGRHALGERLGIAELHAVRQPRDVAQDDVALGNRARVELRARHAERGRVHRRRVHDGVDLRVAPVDRLVVAAGAARVLAGLGPPILHQHEVVNRQAVAVLAVRGDHERPLVEPGGDRALGADEQPLPIAAPRHLADLAPQVALEARGLAALERGQRREVAGSCTSGSDR
jgi:hypothetical protein